MIKPRLRIAAAALACAWVAVARAASPDPLGALVSEALAKNLSLEEARLESRRAASELTAARARWLPAVRLESRASQLHDVQDLGALVSPAYAALNRLTGTNAFPTELHLTLPRANESHVRVSQQLIDEPLRASVSLAAARRDAERAALLTAARRLAADVQIAYLQQASARRVVDIQGSALELVQENERVAERLLAAGRATPEAVHRARADRAEVEQALADAREQAAAAARELNRIVGRPLESPVDSLPDSAFATPLVTDLESALRSALAGREELVGADAGVRAANAGVRAATGAFLPSVAGGLDVAWQGDEWTLDRSHRSWSSSLVASWDLFRGGSDVARRAAARAQVERARVTRRDAAERIAEEVTNAHQSALVAREALATSATRADAARRTYALVHRRYEECSASPLELTEARTQLTTAETNQVLTLYRYAIRRVDLERAAALRDLTHAKGARP